MAVNWYFDIRESEYGWIKPESTVNVDEGGIMARFASVVLNPDLGLRWLETNWTSPEQLQWLRDAKDGIKVYFERWYSKNDDNASESVFITPSLTPRPEQSRFEQWIKSRQLKLSATGSELER
ncbi:hypothetical protein FOQG_17815 [Fusarium oxysporum f. sp. raphani 54005]|uniref:Uncharacterized protein n=1 Tax=Fusarium oxysporum f. sp. raphani 54005 TaxID=1089458 RepID=X0BF52_FUSOX|nr:hypothetical protein FOQG_17815 [Fusarium oxysporum f. sp. raphani 54005]